MARSAFLLGLFGFGASLRLKADGDFKVARKITNHAVCNTFSYYQESLPTIDDVPVLPQGMARYPGLALDPPVKLESFKVHHELTTGRKAPDDYWFLDAVTMLDVIKRNGGNMSMWAINLGAKPQANNVRGGDDVTALYINGYSGMNFDLSNNRKLVDDFYKERGPQMHVAYDVFPDSVADALQRNAVPKEPDFLKVDVDSFDCSFIQAILSSGYRPLVISAEVSVEAVPPLLYSILYRKDHINYQDMSESMLGGCSLQYMHNLIQPFGYTLIQFPLEDGWWVRDEFAHLFGNIPRDLVTLYRIGNPYYFGRHPTNMKRWILNTSIALDEFKDLLQCTVETEGARKGFAGQRAAHFVVGTQQSIV